MTELKEKKDNYFEKNPKKTMALLIFVAIPVLFLLAELIERTYHREWKLQYYITRDTTLLKSSWPAQIDRQLGYVPKEGFDSTENFWGTKVTISEDSIRSNENNIPLKKKVVLAVGDSFTFGDQVSNSETWPSYLEKITQVKVINAGVFGYGLDQAIMRAEILAPKYKPDILIVSFIPADIERCELVNRRNSPKPYYTIKNNTLVLNDSHVTEAGVTEPHPIFAAIRNVMGYSYFAHRIMSRNAPTIWFYGTYTYSKKSGEKGDKIACLLMGKLKELGLSTKTKVILLAQYPPAPPKKEADQSARLLKCASDSGIDVLDLFQTQLDIKTNRPDEFSRMFKGHMSPEGNNFVAREIKKYLVSKGYL